ncbi:MAG: hypothetical protein JEY94_16035 [Melioribacteraceae bacterium]|nr:hypothetical protein [Melioribacteraceae bacterium]
MSSSKNKKVYYAASLYKILENTNGNLKLQSLRDETLFIYCPENSSWLKPYKKEEN